MIREDIAYIFKELGTKHKAVRTSYVGIETEFDLDSDVEYPAMLTTTISDIPIIQQPNYTDQYNVVFWVLDNLDTDRNENDIEESLNRLSIIAKQLLLRLETHYNDKILSINNREVRTDFKLNIASMNQFHDENLQNHTGWQINLTITQRTDKDICCLDDVFDA
jgi:hypothetical protein